MRRAWIDILSRAVVENQRIQRMQKSMSTDGPSTGPIKGRPGLVLMPSKTDPRIKRWQKVGEDEGGQVSGGGAQGEKTPRGGADQSSQSVPSQQPRSHMDEIRGLQQHVRELTLDPSSHEDQDQKRMAGKQLYQDVMQHHGHMLDMIKNKHVSADEAEAYTQTIKDLDTMVGSWDKTSFSSESVEDMHKEAQGAIEEAKNKVSMQLDDGRTADVPSPKGLRKKLKDALEKAKTAAKSEVANIRAMKDIRATGLRGWENQENASISQMLAGDARRSHISMAKSLLRPVAERLAKSKLSERSDKGKLSAFLDWNKKSVATSPTPEEAATTISYWASYGLGAFGIGAATLTAGIVGGLGALATWAVANLIIGPPIWKHITRHIGRIAVEKLTGEKVDRDVWELNEGYINGRQYKDRLIAQGHTEEEAHAKWQHALESRWVKAMETATKTENASQRTDVSDVDYEDLVLQSLQESIPHATQGALQELLDQAPSEYLQRYQDAQAIVKQILNEYDPQLLETADEHTMADISAKALLPFAKTLENEQNDNSDSIEINEESK